MNIIQQYEAAADRPPDRRPCCAELYPGRYGAGVSEGGRRRPHPHAQAFEGVCIARSNKGLNSNFTVRKISYGEGVERVFPLLMRRRLPRLWLCAAAMCAAC